MGVVYISTANVLGEAFGFSIASKEQVISVNVKINGWYSNTFMMCYLYVPNIDCCFSPQWPRLFILSSKVTNWVAYFREVGPIRWERGGN